ncbi:MAG: DUF4296 domain-containing protein [Cyclobacteriaceae bacterium]|nr:DUF4296 domain-containing protein [Cyclobacteriaceae bacterium]
MRFSGIVLMVILSTIVSCKKDTEPGVLTQAQMVDFMLDMYLSEARLQMIPITRDSAFRLFIPRQDSLMRMKGITDSTLRRSYQYYLENPTKMEAIYDIVIDSLSLREQRLLPGPRQPS